jgi:hypothetical protein
MAHLHLTYGTQWLACHLTLVICHKSLRSVLLHPTYGTWRLTCHVYLWDLSLSPSDLWDPMVCVSLVPCVPSGFNFLKKVWYLGVEHGFWTKDWSIFTIVLDAWLCLHLFGVTIVSYWLCGCPTGWAKLDIVPASGNKSMPARLAAVVEVEDPRSTLLAQVSFWWHGGALPVEHSGIGIRMIRCVPW